MEIKSFVTQFDSTELRLFHFLTNIVLAFLIFRCDFENGVLFAIVRGDN